MTDPIANLLTTLRNATQLGRTECHVRYSRFAEQLLSVMTAAGYINGAVKEEGESPLRLRVTLIPAKIRVIERLSKPGRRLYAGYRQIPTVRRGLGTVIVSTPRGLLTGEEAKKQKQGGELICELA